MKVKEMEHHEPEARLSNPQVRVREEGGEAGYVVIKPVTFGATHFPGKSVG